VEEVGDLIVNRQKPLCLSSGFEALHDPLASPRRLMRILRPIVQALVLAMFHAKAHFRSRSAVRTELVRDHHARRHDRGFQELLHEPLRSARVSSALDQDVEHEAILIDGAPQPMLLARDRDNDFENKESGRGRSRARRAEVWPRRSTERRQPENVTSSKRPTASQSAARRDVMHITIQGVHRMPASAPPRPAEPVDHDRHDRLDHFSDSALAD
jgi:hypothetical protein